MDFIFVHDKGTKAFKTTTGLAQFAVDNQETNFRLYIVRDCAQDIVGEEVLEIRDGNVIFSIDLLKNKSAYLLTQEFLADYSNLM